MRSDGILGKLAKHWLAISLENAATLALAFCHSHQLAAQDMSQYDSLEWAKDGEGLPQSGQPLDDLLELAKRNAFEQASL